MNYAVFSGLVLRNASALEPACSIIGLVAVLMICAVPVEASEPITLKDRSLSGMHDEGFYSFAPDSAQADSAEADSSSVPADTTVSSGVNKAFGDSDAATQKRAFSPEDAIPPMEARLPAGFREVFTDSLQRWEQWFNLAERQSYRRGIISYRLGALGRNDGRLIRATAPRHQRYSLEGVAMNDPVSGSMNSNFLPLEHFVYYAERSEGIRYRGDAELRRYHVNKPLTRISFEETADNERRTEALLTRNIGQRNNLALSFRGNNHDGTYRRSQLSGRQASARYSHYLSESWLGQAYLLYNSQQIQQPGGYEIGNPLTFGFVPLQTPVSVTDGRSSVQSTHLGVSLYHRPEPAADRRSRIQLYHQRYRRLYEGNAQQPYFRIFRYGLRADTRRQAGGLELAPFINLSHSREQQDEASVLAVSGWSDFKTGLHARVEAGRRVDLSGWARLHYRSDGGNLPGYEAGYRLDFRPGSGWELYQSLSVGQLISSIQQRYWQSEAFSGAEELDAEQMARAEAGLSWSGSQAWKTGLRGYMSSIRRPVVLAPEAEADGRQHFINIDAYQSLGGEVYAEVTSERIEAGLSATFQQYESSSLRPENLLLTGSGLRNTNRAYFYLKRYFFDFASFAKVGAIATFSPNAIRSSRYYEALDYWDPLPEATPVPAYYRVDLEASGRVRMLMVLLRYENIFDELGQAGYFETARYPMPGRRLRIGLRWILRN